MAGFLLASPRQIIKLCRGSGVRIRSKALVAACCALGALGTSGVNAALSVAPETDAAVLLSNLIAGSSFSTSSATLIGNVGSGSEQQGTFSGGASAGIGLERGVILTSGRALNAIGPNTLPDITSQAGGGGDNGLSTLIGAATLDANVLTFNFLPTTAGTLLFRYVFASDEYNDIGSATDPTPYDDVFGLFVNGANQALVPGFNRVSIKTVNCGNGARGIPTQNLPGGPNCSVFVNNNFDPGAAPYDIQYDGFTQVLAASINVVAGGQYQVQLAIADAPDDRNLDSAVFIAGEFRADGGGNGVPEPGSLALAGLATLLLVAARRRYSTVRQ